jgi:hypothetical protein
MHDDDPLAAGLGGIDVMAEWRLDWSRISAPPADTRQARFCRLPLVKISACSSTGLGHGVYKDNVDYSAFCGEWCIGGIYETRTGPADLRWFWALYTPSKLLEHPIDIRQHVVVPVAQHSVAVRFKNLRAGSSAVDAACGPPSTRR